MKPTSRPPAIPKDLVPRHVAIVMDGNGRWAKQRGLPRTRGHEMGEHSLFDVVEGAIEIGVKAISAYAFSTENWTRSPDEVKAVTKPCLRHRIQVRPELELEGTTVDGILDGVLASVPVPR